MKKLLAALVATAVLASAAQAAEEKAIDKNVLSYALGFQAGFDFKARKLDIDSAKVKQGLSDALAGKEPAFSKEEMVKALTALQEKLKKEQIEQLKKLAADNLAKSEKFLKENGKKKGVITLPSGVQYKVIEEGTGAKPKLSDTVLLHYRGSLMDGFEFDSSFARGKPNLFKVEEVLPGWQEVLPRMRKGAEWKVYIPPELGYGIRAPRPIGPNEVLIFDLKLVEINPPVSKGGKGK